MVQFQMVKIKLSNFLAHYQQTLMSLCLIQLKKLTKLEYLNLSYTEVTDAGLVHLEGLTKLSWLWLQGTKVSEDAVKKLQQALPGCNIFQ